MSATVVIRPASLRVEPGAEASVEVAIRNTGTIVEEFSIEVLGDSTAFATAEPKTLSLFPSQEGTARITFRPPRSSEVPAGTIAFGVKITPKEAPQETLTEEGSLEVGPFSEVSAELVPRTTSGRASAKAQLAVDNRGNALLNATVTAADADDLLSFDIDPPSIVAEPGTAAFSNVKVKPKKRFLRGQPQTRPFEVTVQAEGAPPVVVEGSMLQQALIPKWLPAALAALVALVLLWAFVLRPTVQSLAKDAVREPLETAQSQIADLAKKLGETPPPIVEPPESPGPAVSPSAITTVVTPPTPVPPGPFDLPIGATARTGARDGAGSFRVPARQLLSVTDLVLQNPTADTGTVTVLRGGSPLLRLRLENFRDIDYHFVSPVVFRAGQSIVLSVHCENAGPPAANPCNAYMYVVGTIRRV